MPADEVSRSVVQFVGETKDAEDALARILAHLERIEQATTTTAQSWEIALHGADRYAVGLQRIGQQARGAVSGQRELAAAAREVNAVMALRAELRPGQAAPAAAAPVMPEAWALREELQAGGPSQAYMWSQMTEEQQTHIQSIHDHGQALAAQAAGLRDVTGAQEQLSGATEDNASAQQQAGQAIKEQTGLLSGLGRSFQVHLRWMLRYIILWKGMQLVVGTVKEWFRVNAELDRSLTLLETSIGGNIGLLREYRDAMFAAAEAGRALPTEMAPAAVMVGRIYDPEQAEEMMTRAAELAFISGAKVEDVTRSLIVVQRQLGLGSEEMASMMDALAGSLRNTHLTYADLIPMLNRAVVYSDRYNMTLEETIGIQAGVASATGATGSELDSFMRRLTSIYETRSTTYQTLLNLGIATVQVGESGEQIRMPLIAVFEAIGKAVEGDEGRLEDLSKAMFRVGSANRAVFEAAIRNVGLVTQSYYDATQAAGQWEDTMSEMETTMVAATAHMKGGWQELLAAIRWDDTVIVGIRALGEFLHQLADFAVEVGDAWEAMGQKVGRPFSPWGWDRGYTPGATPPVAVPERGVPGEMVDYPRLPPGGAGGPQLPAALDVRTTTLEVPEGANFDDVIASYEQIVDRWIGTFQDQQGQYYRITDQQIDAARSLSLVWDATAGEFRVLNAFMPALQEAIKENTAALKAPSLRFMPFDPVRWAGPIQRLIGYYERVASGLGFKEEPQAQVLWGPEDSILQLNTSNIVLQMVMHSLTEAIEENTEALNEGMWNIPEGVTALVPITSLFYQNLQKPGQDKWASADIAAEVARIIGGGAALGAAGGGGRGGGGGLGVPPGAYDFYVPGRSPYTPLNEAGSDLTRSATILARAGYALGQAASRVAYKGYQGGPEYDFYLPPIPKLGAGAIVMGPTVAMIGDEGPEAVVPLGGAMAGQEAVFHITLMLNERVLAEFTRKAVAEVL